MIKRARLYRVCYAVTPVTPKPRRGEKGSRHPAPVHPVPRLPHVKNPCNPWSKIFFPSALRLRFLCPASTISLARGSPQFRWLRISATYGSHEGNLRVYLRVEPSRSLGFMRVLTGLRVKHALCATPTDHRASVVKNSFPLLPLFTLHASTTCHSTCPFFH